MSGEERVKCGWCKFSRPVYNGDGRPIIKISKCSNSKKTGAAKRRPIKRWWPRVCSLYKDRDGEKDDRPKEDRSASEKSGSEA